MFPRGDIDDVIGMLNVIAVKHEEWSRGHIPAYGSACMDYHVAVLTGIIKVAVCFEVELVVHRYTDSRHYVEARGMLDVPGRAYITTPGRDPHLCNQPWSHGLALLWSVAVAVAHRVFAHEFLNLSNSMVQHLLECNQEMHRVEVVDIVVSVSREASAAWNHKPYILVDVKHVVRGPEVARATMLVLRKIGANMLTRKVSVEGHVLATHLIVLQRNNNSIA